MLQSKSTGLAWSVVQKTFGENLLFCCCIRQKLKGDVGTVAPQQNRKKWNLILSSVSGKCLESHLSRYSGRSPQDPCVGGDECSAWQCGLGERGRGWREAEQGAVARPGAQVHGAHGTRSALLQSWPGMCQRSVEATDQNMPHEERSGIISGAVITRVQDAPAYEIGNLVKSLMKSCPCIRCTHTFEVISGTKGGSIRG